MTTHGKTHNLHEGLIKRAYIRHDESKNTTTGPEVNSKEPSPHQSGVLKVMCTISSSNMR